MAEESKVAHKHISYFNPDVLLLEQSHQDFSASFLNCIYSEDAKKYRNNPRNQRLLQIAAEELSELP